MNLTLQELIILIIVIAVISSIIISIIKCSLKIFATGAIILVLFSGFTWLPELIANWTGTEPPIQEVDPQFNFGVDNTVSVIVDDSMQFIDKHKDSWIASAQSLWNKITGNAEEGQQNSEKIS